MLRSNLLVVGLLFLSSAWQGFAVSIWPQPYKVELGTSAFLVSPEITIKFEGNRSCSGLHNDRETQQFVP